MSKVFHPFHMVTVSPWPIVVSWMSLFLTTSVVVFFKTSSYFWFVTSLFGLFLFTFFWWRDVIRESLFGDRSSLIQDSLKWGMGLFIGSEVLFFGAWFWAFFHHSIAPTGEVGMVWPPFSLEVLSPFQVPLLNTLILLSSGVSVTWAHHNLLLSRSLTISMVFTLILGALFSFFQWVEYQETSFSMAEGAFGGSFFMTTGFHGIHVLIGTCFLLVSLIRSLQKTFSTQRHLGVEFSIWYWHFVDVVWLFLFSFLYWWTT